MSDRIWIKRYDDAQRLNHWFVVICFFMAALSGLAIFHPAMFFLTNFFGGGQWTRILHPFMGLAMCFGFLGMALHFWHENRFNDADKQWMKQWRDVVTNREEDLPPVGRYNAGQKAVFWLMVVCLAVMFVTGFMFWEPWFAPYVPITLRRLAVLLHAASAAVLIIGIIVHAYAAIWVKGSIGAMTRGYVSDRWARRHHAAWYREVMNKEQRP